MSYIANQYNYATPLSSAAGLTNEDYNVADIKYFTLSDNVLDGSYRLISDDVGLWSASSSDENGILATPLIVTITEELRINALSIIGSVYSYPVDFTIKFYSGSELLYTAIENGNSDVECLVRLPRMLSVTSYEVSISKVSAPNSVVRLYGVHEQPYVSRVDSFKISATEISGVSQGLYKQSSDMLSVESVESTASDSIIAIVVHSSDALYIKDNTITTGNISTFTDDNLNITYEEISSIRNTIDVMQDTLKANHIEKSSMLNTIDVTTDYTDLKIAEDISHVTNTFDVIPETLSINSEDTPLLTNVHTRMKDTTRRIYGKVYITYTDPMLENETTVETNMEAYNSVKEQVMDGIMSNNELFFTLYDNDLTGSYKLMSEYSQVGWVSGSVSNEAREFTNVPYLRINFSTRPITPLTVYFDYSHGNTAEEFSVEFVRNGSDSVIKSFTNNHSAAVLINEEVVTGVDAIIIRVYKTTKPNYPISILEVPVLSTLLYKGYKDTSDLISIDMLEELTYEDDVEALGGVSANEVTIALDNSKRLFYFNNTNSAVSKQLRRNRRIEPWLGTEIIPGEIEWYKLGTYWSYSWDVPVNSLIASVVGFDTLGLLDTTDFKQHYVQTNKSLGELIEYVLTDAKQSLYFINWKIDDSLYDVKVPYAWFEQGSHTAALRKISSAYPMHVYCDRDGFICAAPQRINLDFYYDVWSDSTNVISKEYSSLYTTLPNIVNVNVKMPTLVENDNLVQDNLSFDVSSMSTRVLNFSKPYLSEISVSVDKDDTVSYSYVAYSWGIEFTFTGTGTVRSINCVGTSVDTSNTSSITRRNEESIRTDGALVRNVEADFIQTSEIATIILDRIFKLSTNDKYDATVTYRGDISLSINDPILLLDGIAPDNRYNIRRHQLSWNGALSGTADLNT